MLFEPVDLKTGSSVADGSHVSMLDDTRAGVVVERRRIPGYAGVVGVDDSGLIRYISPDLDGRFGVSIADALGRSFLDYVDVGDAGQAIESFGGVTERHGHHQALDLHLRGDAGQMTRVDVVAENCLATPEIGLVLLNIGDPLDRRRSVHLLDAQAEVVKQIALSGSLEAAVAELLSFVQTALPGFSAAAFYHDSIRAGRATAAPGLDGALTQRIAAAIRTDEGYPGAVALAEEETIIAADLTDERWASTQLVGLDAASIWSVPIRYDRGSDCLGCIEIYGPHAAHPRDEDWAILQLASRLAAVAFDRIRMQERLVRDAEIDPLTGTPHRRVIRSTLGSVLAGEERGHVVCFIDLDRLKVVNDGLGHEAGDHVIREAARRLREQLGPIATVGRFGGDEFVAIANDPTVSCDEMAERCLRAFAEPVFVAGRRWQLSASVGVVEIDAQSTPGEVLRDADAAMYEAKRAGRGHWHLFASSTRESVVRRMQLEQRLPDAVAGGEIGAWFQPVVSAADWSLVGLETLARWQPDGDDLIAPSEFIPLVEELGLIDALGQQMIDHAFDGLRALGAVGLGHCEVSVNVSPLQLQSDGLVERLSRARDERMPMSALSLEMTEQHMIDDTDRTLGHLERLLEFGVGLAVDDFGTGYSSLGALHQLPAKTLKIDRRLVSQVVGDAGSSVISAVIGVARAYGMATVGEGVETVEQALQLRKLGVDSLQGYLFARPAPLDEMIDRLSAAGWCWDVARSAVT